VQEAMLRALQSFGGFRGDDGKPWLLAIVRNCHRTIRKRQANAATVPIEEEIDTGDGGLFVTPVGASDSNPESTAAGNADRRQLDLVLATMPEAFREVLVLRELEELSYRQIADITDVPIGTVMSRLARARALLKQRWLQMERSRP